MKGGHGRFPLRRNSARDEGVNVPFPESVHGSDDGNRNAGHADSESCGQPRITRHPSPSNTSTAYRYHGHRDVGDEASVHVSSVKLWCRRLHSNACVAVARSATVRRGFVLAAGHSNRRSRLMINSGMRSWWLFFIATVTARKSYLPTSSNISSDQS